MRYNFSPAGPDEDIVYGACRPEYTWFAGAEGTRDDWLAYMRDRGIERVCCLLETDHETDDGLLETYCETFGKTDVCHAPVPDRTLIDAESFHERVLPFLSAGVARDAKTVVHCSAGMGRTGHVLALWLAAARQYNVAEAITTVEEMGREPTEARGPTATAPALREILASGFELA